MGRMTSHIWNGKKNMFQTTNQILDCSLDLTCKYCDHHAYYSVTAHDPPKMASIFHKPSPDAPLRSLPCPSSCYWWHVPDPWLHSPRCRTRDLRWKVSWADPRDFYTSPAMAIKKWLEQEHVKLDYIWYIQQISTISPLQFISHGYSTLVNNNRMYGAF